MLPHGVDQPPGNLAPGPFAIDGMEVCPDIRAAVGIMNPSRNLGGRRRADPGIDLDLLKPDQHRFEIAAGRLRWRVSMLTDRPIAAQPELQFHT